MPVFLGGIPGSHLRLSVRRQTRNRALIMPMRDLARALTVTVVFTASLVHAQAFFTPEQISNDYSFLREGENVRIDVQGNQLRGYVNTHGSSETDSHLILAMFFQKATLDGNK